MSKFNPHNSTMAEKTAEIQTAVENHLQDTDKRYLRGIRKEMYECSVLCCSNTSASVQQVSLCLEECSVKMTNAHNFLTSQINDFQNRLHRCVSQCNDEAKDLFSSTNPTDKEVAEVNKHFDKCACSCMDKHIEMIPQFMSRVHKVLSANKDDSVFV